MLDTQRLVEGLRNVLYSWQQPLADVLQSYSEDYAQACHEVNRRLARCEEFLRQGLLAEAIQYAQIDPNLLDMLTVLDFPERQNWISLLQANNLPAPPLLRIESAQALNHAYVRAQPMEDLLRKHRALALVRAPLSQRLAIMYELARIDAGNPVWQQDVAIFERERVPQMQAEVEELQRQYDMPTLERVQGLVEEVQAFRIRPPKGLVAAVQDMFQRVNAKQLQTRLKQIAFDLNAAHKSRDEPRARSLAEDWHQTYQQCPLPKDDKRRLAADLALNWLDRMERQRAETDAHEQALKELREALNKRKIREEELEEIYHEAAAFPAGIPWQMQDNYERRINRYRRAEKIRERLLLTIVIVFGVGLLVYGLAYLKLLKL